MKVLIVLLAIFLLFWAARLLRRSRRVPQRQSPRREADMVQCAYCGLHIPETEAIAQDGRHYCCQAHRQVERTGK